MSEVGVLDKVMAILQSFTNGSARLQPAQVAAKLGIAPPTAYRLMKSMAEHGLLEHDAQGYRLGVVLLHLGSRVADGLDLNHLARPHLEWLRDQTSENAELHLLHGCNRVPIEVMASRQNLRPMGQVGVPFPLHGGASAKVLLAWLEPQERQSLVMASHERDSSARPFDFTGWERQLARTRKQGWAESDGERESGVSSIAAPIRDRVGAVVAAMVLSGPTTRLTERSVRTAAVQATVESAAWVSRAVGNVDVPASRRLP